MRIGILGGSFDPVHDGHVALAQAAIRELRLDRLFFLPAKNSPLKLGTSPVPSRHRVNMIRLVARGIPRSAVSQMELRSSGPSYTVQTLRRFRKKYPGGSLFFVMGSDSLAAFKLWKDWRKIPSLCTLAVGLRRGRRDRIALDLRKKVLWLKSKMPPASSTEIRAGLKSGGKPPGGIPREVAGYILRQRLYSFS